MGNFTQDEDDFMTDYYLAHHEVFKSTARSANANQKRNQLFAELLKEINSNSPDNQRTLDQVRERIQYIQGRSKRKFSDFQKLQRRTGDAPSKVPKLSESEKKFVEKFGATAGFSGIPGGIESGGEKPNLDRSPREEEPSNDSHDEQPLDFVDGAESHIMGSDLLLSQSIDQDISSSSSGFSAKRHGYSTSLGHVQRISTQTVHLVQTVSATPPTAVASVAPATSALPQKAPRATKQAKLLDSKLESSQLQTKVLEMQLKAAESTIQVNQELSNILGRVGNLVDVMENYFQRDPVVVINAQSVSAASGDLVSETPERENA